MLKRFLVFAFLISLFTARAASIESCKHEQKRTFDGLFSDYLKSGKEKVKRVRYRSALPKDSVPTLIIRHCLNSNKERHGYDLILLRVNYDSADNIVFEMDFCFRNHIDNSNLAKGHNRYGYFRYEKWDVFVSGNAAKRFFCRCHPRKRESLSYKVNHPIFELMYCPQFNPKYVQHDRKITVEYDGMLNEHYADTFLDYVYSTMIKELELNPENVYFEKSGLFDFSRCSFFPKLASSYQSGLQYSKDEDLIQIELFDGELLNRKFPKEDVILYSTPSIGRYVGVLRQSSIKCQFFVLELTGGDFRIVQSIDL